MNKFTYQCILISLLFIYINDIDANSGINFDQPYLEPNRVILIAELYLKNKSINTNEYNLLSITFDYISRKWWIFYDEKDGPLGGHFVLSIDDCDDPNIHREGGA